MLEVPTEVIGQFWQLIVAVIAAIIAYLQTKKAATVTAAYDVNSAVSSDKTVIATLPERTWKMSDATKEWLTFDATAENKAKILAQIDAAEKDHLVKYQIDFAGGYYLIEYGLQYGGAGNPSGHNTN